MDNSELYLTLLEALNDESPEQESHTRRLSVWRIWRALVALSAFLDFLSVVLDQWYFSTHEEDEDDAAADNVTPPPVLGEWIRRNGSNFAQLFALLWFLDAFVAAIHLRRKKASEIERERVLRGASSKEIGTWQRGAWGFYLHAVTRQILLLPVSFFVRIILAFRDIDSIALDSFGIFSLDSNASLAWAGLNYVHMMLWESREYLDDTIHRMFMIATRHMLLSLFRHPRKFVREIRGSLKATRWARLFLPLLRSLHKTKDRISQLNVKLRQYLAAEAAKQWRMERRRRLPREELLNHDAIVIQATFRSHHCRKVLRVLLALRLNKETQAALKIQRAFREKRFAERQAIARKCERMKLLKTKEGMSVVEVRHLYQLRQELRAKTERLNRHLLLRPDSKLAVRWAFALLILASLEVLRDIFAIIYMKKSKTGLGLVDQVLPWQTRELEKICRRHYPGRAGRFRRVIAVLKTLGRKPKEDLELPPSYCTTKYIETHRFAETLLFIAFDKVMGFFSSLLLLDVWVSFFTGQLDDHGCLVPRPFFRRWIFPGILLQLAVNPALENVADKLRRLVLVISRSGPHRLFRWTVALFYPISVSVSGILGRLWVYFALPTEKRRSIKQKSE